MDSIGHNYPLRNRDYTQTRRRSDNLDISPQQLGNPTATSNYSVPPSKRAIRAKRKREEKKSDLADTVASSLNTQDQLALNTGEIKNCIICLDTEHLQERKCTPCGHTFHSQCLKRWLAKKNECPICRSLVDADQPRIKRRNLNGTLHVSVTYGSSSRISLIRYGSGWVRGNISFF